MNKLADRIEAEIENINKTLEKLPNHKKLPYLSVLELAGVAALIHNYYNGIENILKQILRYEKVRIPSGSSWHKDLLNLVEDNNIISSETKKNLIDYLAFRHFFSHSYALDLYHTKMEPLVKNIHTIFEKFQIEIDNKIQRLIKEI